jgi:hypothetical protein
MKPWLRYLIAFVVAGHGLIYVIVGSLLPISVKEWTGRSWLLGSAVTDDRLRAVVIALHVIAGLAILACAVAIGPAPSAPAWWRPLALLGAAIGIAAFAVFWDGQTQYLVQEGAIGAVLSLVLFAIAWSRVLD